MTELKKVYYIAHIDDGMEDIPDTLCDKHIEEVRRGLHYDVYDIVVSKKPPESAFCSLCI